MIDEITKEDEIIKEIVIKVRKRSPDMNKPYYHNDLIYAIQLALNYSQSNGKGNK